MMSSFNIAYNKTMSYEGNYSNDTTDRGGETWKGISRKYHPDWAGWMIIDQLKNELNKNELNEALSADIDLECFVLDFYISDYWEPLQLDSIDTEIACEVFDTAVNQGKSTAAKYLQEALNLLNNNEKYYSDIKVDGYVGAKTLKAYRAYMLTANFPSRSVERNIIVLLKALDGLQFQKYVGICEENKGQETYFYGWLTRV